MVLSVPPIQYWELYVNGVANKKGSGIRIVIVSPERITIKKSLRLDFLATNNEAEYEALMAGLSGVKRLGGGSRTGPRRL